MDGSEEPMPKTEPQTPRICRVFSENAMKMRLSYGGWHGGWVCVCPTGTLLPISPINSTPRQQQGYLRDHSLGFFQFSLFSEFSFVILGFQQESFVKKKSYGTWIMTIQ